MELIAGGWATNAHNWNALIAETAPNVNRISIAPYLAKRIERFETPEDRYLSLFADAEVYQRDEGASILREMADTSTPKPLAVYELNTHLSHKKTPPRVASAVASSLGSGIAVFDHALMLMANQKTDPVVFFTLLQRGFGTGDEERTGLWGIYRRSDDGTIRPRPIGQAWELGNRHLIEGDMVETQVRNSPTFDHAQNGSIPEIDDVPYVTAYAFKRPEGGYNVALVNRHLSASQSIELALPNEELYSAQRYVLTGPSPEANNEAAQQVELKGPMEVTESASYSVPLPPCSIPVIQLRPQAA